MMAVGGNVHRCLKQQVVKGEEVGVKEGLLHRQR